MSLGEIRAATVQEWRERFRRIFPQVGPVTPERTDFRAAAFKPPVHFGTLECRRDALEEGSRSSRTGKIRDHHEVWALCVPEPAGFLGG